MELGAGEWQIGQRLKSKTGVMLTVKKARPRYSDSEPIYTIEYESTIFKGKMLSIERTREQADSDGIKEA